MKWALVLLTQLSLFLHMHAHDIPSSCQNVCTRTKQIAAERIRNGTGYMYVTHFHKAAGSSLCSLIIRSGVLRLPSKHINCNGIHRRKLLRSPPPSWGAAETMTYFKEENANVLFSEDLPHPRWISRLLTGQSDQSIMADWTFVTILRHPIRRIMSHYDFQRQRKEYQSYADWAEEFRYYGNNHMVRVLSSGWTPTMDRVDDLDAAITEWPRANRLDRDYQKVVKDVPDVTRADLELAKQVLSKYSVILITEQMPDSAPLLGHWFGFHSIDDIRPRDNGQKLSSKHAVHGKLSKTDLARLEDLNVFDIELYEYAIQLSRCNVEINSFRHHSEKVCEKKLKR